MRQLPVSIVMPTRNYGHFIGDALRSVAAQTHPHIETVVIDDGSTDDTQSVIAGFNVVSLHADGIGASAARNIGLDRATGDCVLFLDADDLLEPDAVAALVAANADVAIGRWRNFSDDPAIGEVHVCQRPFKTPTFANVIMHRPVAGAVLFRRQSDRFDASLKTSEHLDYLLRTGSRKPSVAYVDKVTTDIRQHKSASRLTIAHDHFDPVHRLEIVKRYRPAYASHDRQTVAAVDHLTMSLALEKHRRGRGLDPVVRDVDLHNLAKHGLLPRSWHLLRFGLRAGIAALRAYEALRS